jgi:hypothetical protein
MIVLTLALTRVPQAGAAMPPALTVTDQARHGAAHCHAAL